MKNPKEYLDPKKNSNNLRVDLGPKPRTLPLSLTHAIQINTQKYKKTRQK